MRMRAIYYHLVKKHISVLGDLDLTGTANKPLKSIKQ